MKEPRLIPVGKITRPHGVRGLLKIFPYGETLSVLSAGETLYVRSATGTIPVTVASLKPQGRLWIARMEESTSVETARSLAGGELLLPEDRLPPAGEGEYYHYQLIGLNVETKDGERVGVLKGILEAGGNDVYALDRDGREVLIPAVEEIVLRVDLENGRMIVDPPEGLIDGL